MALEPRGVNRRDELNYKYWWNLYHFAYVTFILYLYSFLSLIFQPSLKICVANRNIGQIRVSYF